MFQGYSAQFLLISKAVDHAHPTRGIFPFGQMLLKLSNDTKTILFQKVLQIEEKETILHFNSWDTSCSFNLTLS